MKNVERSYEALQSSWFSGESLTDAEEQRRRELASQDPLFAAECAILAELKQRLEVSCPSVEDVALIDRVLSHPDLSPQLPRLRLLRHEVSAPPAPVRARFGNGRAKAWALAAVALLVTCGVAMWLKQLRPPNPWATLPASKSGVAMATAPARAELVFTSGQHGTGAQALPLGGRPLTQGAVVETAAGQACLTIDPGVDVCLGAWSQVELRSLRVGQLEVEVKRGLVLATLTQRAPGHTFSLSSSGVRATAIGTTFGFDVRGPVPEVVVLEGTVKVNGGAASELVHGHSRWRAAPSVRPSQSAIGRAEEATFWALLAPRGLWRHSEVGILELRSTATGLTVAIDGSHRFPLPLSTFLPAGKHELKVRNTLGAEASYALEVDAGEHKTLTVADPLENKTAGVSEARSSAPSIKTSAPSPTSLLERARAELRSGNVGAALNGYAELRRVFPASPEAWTVLPIMGRLELEQRKAPARALAFFDTYLSRPGPLRQEALSGRIRALKVLGRNSEERLAIGQYLTRYPNSLETSALRQRLHTLAAP